MAESKNSQHSIPNKVALIKNIQKNFPKHQLNKPIWLAYYYKLNKDGLYTKPPCADKGHTVSDDKLGVTFDQAIKDGYPGIKINSQTNLIAFDVDDKEAKLGNRKFSIDRLSQQFQEFMMDHDSYTELSPSKCGLRIMMTCKDKTDLPNKASLLGELCIGGELYINSGYVTITGDQIAGTRLSSITAAQLKPWFEMKKKEPADVIEFPVKSKIPQLNDVMQALKCCRLDQGDRVKKAYTSVIGEDYSHYDYWLKIMSACHHYAQVSNQMSVMTMEVVEWSKTDEMSYESEEDVIKHWASFSDKDNAITFHTLFKFAKLLKFQWPEEAYDNKGNPTGKPMIYSMINFEYMMGYLNIEIYQDIFNGLLYIKGDNNIIEKFVSKRANVKTFFGMQGPLSMKGLQGILFEISQQNGYTNIAMYVLTPLIKLYVEKNTNIINILEMWLETAPDLLADDMVEKDTNIKKSNLDYLLSCIKFKKTQNMELARTYFDTFFYEMMMPIYNKQRLYSQRSFMLIMTGPEACRKTTFFTMLFPENLRRQFVTSTNEKLGGAKSIRDFAASMVTSALVVTDEFEIFYNKENDSLFKAFVTSDTIDYVPIYEKTMVKANKNAVLAGTTNKKSLPFEQDSNRRLALISVEFIDTDAMQEINWHHFYRTYIAKAKTAMINRQYPWKLPKETIKLQYQENEQFRAQTNSEIIIRELFDFDMTIHSKIIDYDCGSVQTNSLLSKISDITSTIKQRYPNTYISPAELKHLLKRLCGKYTKTTNKRIELRSCKGYIEDGIVHQGQWTRYVMPPRLIDEFE